MKCHIQKSNNRIADTLYYTGHDNWSVEYSNRMVFESMRAAMTRNKIVKGVIVPES